MALQRLGDFIRAIIHSQEKDQQKWGFLGIDGG
jgi:hypothetical protein